MTIEEEIHRVIDDRRLMELFRSMMAPFYRSGCKDKMVLGVVGDWFDDEGFPALAIRYHGLSKGIFV